VKNLNTHQLVRDLIIRGDFAKASVLRNHTMSAT